MIAPVTGRCPFCGEVHQMGDARSPDDCNRVEGMSEWETDCLRWHGRNLTGIKAHWCWDWDMLPIDETCPEMEACTCKGKDNG